MSGPTRAKSLREMGNISNISDRQLLKRFIEEHSLPAIYKPEDRRFKYVLAYYVPDELRDFIFDPIRSRCFYPTSWIIDKCQWAMKELQSNPQFHSSFLLDFFQPCAVVGVSDANRLLEHVRNGSDNNDLLLFLKYLSEIHWLDFYTRGWYGRQVANGIVRWVCTALVG
jgi:hypothetical protein